MKQASSLYIVESTRVCTSINLCGVFFSVVLQELVCLCNGNVRLKGCGTIIVPLLGCRDEWDLDISSDSWLMLDVYG